MDAPVELGELVLQAVGHHFQAEVEEVPEHLLEVETLRPAGVGIFGRHQARHVDGERRLQRRVLEQVRHDQVIVGARLDVQLNPHIVGRDVADINQVRHLAAQHHVADLLDQLRFVHRIRDAGDVELLLRARDRAGFPGRAETNGTRAGAVDFLELVGRVQDVAAGREIRPLDPAAQLQGGEVGIFEQLDQRGDDLVEVVRRDVGGHAHGDAGAAVDQQVGHARRQHHRFDLGAVVTGAERHRFLLDLLQYFVRQPGQAALRVTHGRGTIAVERAEVA